MSEQQTGQQQESVPFVETLSKEQLAQIQTQAQQPIREFTDVKAEDVISDIDKIVGEIQDRNAHDVINMVHHLRAYEESNSRLVYATDQVNSFAGYDPQDYDGLFFDDGKTDPNFRLRVTRAPAVHIKAQQWTQPDLKGLTPKAFMSVIQFNYETQPKFREALDKSYKETFGGGVPYDERMTPEENEQNAIFTSFFNAYGELKQVPLQFLNSPYFQSLTADEIRSLVPLIKDDVFQKVVEETEAINSSWYPFTSFSRQQALNQNMQMSLASSSEFERLAPYIAFLRKVQSDNRSGNVFIQLGQGLQEYFANAASNIDKEKLNLAGKTLIASATAGALAGAATGAVAGGVGAAPGAASGAVIGGVKGAVSALAVLGIINQADNLTLQQSYDQLTIYNTYNNLAINQLETSSAINRQVTKAPMNKPQSWRDMLELAEKNRFQNTAAIAALDLCLTFYGGKVAQMAGAGAMKVAGKMAKPVNEAVRTPLSNLLGFAPQQLKTFSKFTPKAVASNGEKVGVELKAATSTADTGATAGAKVEASAGAKAETASGLPKDVQGQQALLNEAVSSTTTGQLGKIASTVTEEGQKVIEQINAIRSRAVGSTLLNTAAMGTAETAMFTGIAGVHSGLHEAGLTEAENNVLGKDNNYWDNFFDGLYEGLIAGLKPSATFAFALRSPVGVFRGYQIHKAFANVKNVELMAEKNFLAGMASNPLLKAKILDEVIATGRTQLPKEFTFKGEELESALRGNPELADSNLMRLYLQHKERNGGQVGDMTVSTGELLTFLNDSPFDKVVLKNHGRIDGELYTYSEALDECLAFSNIVVEDYLRAKLTGVKVENEAAHSDALNIDLLAERERAKVETAMSNRITVEELDNLSAARDKNLTELETESIVRGYREQAEVKTGEKPVEGETTGESKAEATESAAAKANNKIEPQELEMSSAIDRETAERSKVYKNMVSETRAKVNLTPKMMQTISDITYATLKKVSSILGQSIDDLLKDPNILPNIRVVKEIKSSNPNEKISGTYDPTTNTITFVEQADIGTIVHEHAHFVLEILLRTADKKALDIEAVRKAIEQDRVATTSRLQELKQQVEPLAENITHAETFDQVRQIKSDATVAAKEATAAAERLDSPEIKALAKEIVDNLNKVNKAYTDDVVAKVAESDAKPAKEKQKIASDLSKLKQNFSVMDRYANQELAKLEEAKEEAANAVTKTKNQISNLGKKIADQQEKQLKNQAKIVEAKERVAQREKDFEQARNEFIEQIKAEEKNSGKAIDAESEAKQIEEAALEEAEQLDTRSRGKGKSKKQKEQSAALAERNQQQKENEPKKFTFVQAVLARSRAVKTRNYYNRVDKEYQEKITELQNKVEQKKLELAQLEEAARLADEKHQAAKADYERGIENRALAYNKAHWEDTTAVYEQVYPNSTTAVQAIQDLQKTETRINDLEENLKSVEKKFNRLEKRRLNLEKEQKKLIPKDQKQYDKLKQSLSVIKTELDELNKLRESQFLKAEETRKTHEERVSNYQQSQEGVPPKPQAAYVDVFEPETTRAAQNRERVKDTVNRDLIRIEDEIRQKSVLLNDALDILNNAQKKLDLFIQQTKNRKDAATLQAIKTLKEAVYQARLLVEQEQKNYDLYIEGYNKARKGESIEKEIELSSQAKTQGKTEAELEDAYVKLEESKSELYEFYRTIAQFRDWAGMKEGELWKDLDPKRKADLHEKFVANYIIMHLDAYTGGPKGMNALLDRALLESYRKRKYPDSKTTTSADDRLNYANEFKEDIKSNLKESYGIQDYVDGEILMSRFVDELAENYFTMNSPTNIFTSRDIKAYGSLDAFMPFLTKDAQEILQRASFEVQGEIEAAYAKNTLSMVIATSKKRHVESLVKMIESSNLPRAVKEAQIARIRQLADQFEQIRKRVSTEYQTYRQGDKTKMVSKEKKMLFEEHDLIKELLRKVLNGQKGYGARLVDPIGYDQFVTWLKAKSPDVPKDLIKEKADLLYGHQVLTKKNGIEVGQFQERMGFKSEQDMMNFFASLESFVFSDQAFISKLAREEFLNSVRDLDKTNFQQTMELSKLDSTALKFLNRYSSIIFQDLFKYKQNTFELQLTDPASNETKRVKVYDFESSIKQEALNQMNLMTYSQLNRAELTREANSLFKLGAKEAMRGNLTQAGYYLRASKLKTVMALQADAMKTALNVRLNDYKRVFLQPDEVVARNYNVDTIRKGQMLLTYLGTGKRSAYFEREVQLSRVDPDQLGVLSKFMEGQDKVLFYKDMPVKDLTAALDTLESLRTQAREQWKAAQEAKDLSKEIGELTGLVDEELRYQNRNVKEGTAVSALQNEDTRPFYKRLFDTNIAGTMKIEYFCEYVQGKTNGRVKDILYLPMRKAQTQYSKAERELSLQMDNIMREADKEFGKPLSNGDKQYVLRGADGTGLKVKVYDSNGQITEKTLVLGTSSKYKGRPRTELFGLMLHWGNESNRARLAAGLGVGVEQLEAAFRRAERDGVITDKMWDYAQQIWDIYDTQLPKSLETFHKLNGYYFDVVINSEFTTATGKKVKGGYIPIVYIEDLGNHKMQLEDLNRGATEMLPQTAPSFTASRTGLVYRQIDIDPGHAVLGMRKQLRYQYFAEPGFKLYNMMENNELARKLGLLQHDFKKIYQEWILDILNQNSVGHVSPVFQRANMVAHGILSNSNSSALAGNLGNILTGFANISVMIARIGVDGLAMGMTYLMKTQEIAARSNFMSERLVIQRKSVSRACARLDRRLLSRIDNSLEFLNDYSYYAQAKLQSLLDRVTWGGAYQKALKTGIKNPKTGKRELMTEEEAVKFADASVRDSQGSFDLIDKSAVDRANALIKCFVPFCSYFIAMGNLIRTDLHNAGRYNTAFERLMNRAMFLTLEFYLPSVLGDLFTQTGKGVWWDDSVETSDALASAFIFSPLKTGALMKSPFASPINVLVDTVAGKTMGSNSLYQNMSFSILSGAFKSTAKILFNFEDATAQDYINLTKLLNFRYGFIGALTNNVSRAIRFAENN